MTVMETGTSSKERSVGNLSDIPPGEGRTFAVGGRRIAVFHTRDGELFATQADCPHRGGPLADGLLGGRMVVCPLHDRSWDMKTGLPVAPSDCALEVFSVHAEEDGTIMLGG